MVPKEIKDYVKGLYGKPPAQIDPEVKKKIIGDEEPITTRPADLLESALDKIPEDVKLYIESEEDRLAYVLFPQTALEFFKKRKARREEAESGILPERAIELEEAAAVSVAVAAYLKSSKGIKALIPIKTKGEASNWILASRRSLAEHGA